MGSLRLTGTGLALAGTGAVCYASAYFFGYSALAAVALGVLAMLALSGLTVAVKPSVALSRQVFPERVTVGESSLGKMTVQNLSRWPAPSFTATESVGGEPVALAVRALAGRASRVIHYPVPAPRRGRLRLGPLTVRRQDALGLFSWRQQQSGEAVLWVHPRVHSLPPLPVGIVLDYEGSTTLDAKQGKMTFSSLRGYVPGDDPRQIHWRSTARTGTLMVREHVDTTEPATTVVLDTRARSLDAQSFEEAVEFTASLVRAVEQTGRPVALHIVGEQLAEAVGEAGAVSTLDRLCLAQQASGLDSVPLAETVDRIAARGALVVVTGSLNPEEMGRLVAQRGKFSPIVAAMINPQSAMTGIQRRRGVTILNAGNVAEAVAVWHRMIGGERG